MGTRGDLIGALPRHGGERESDRQRERERESEGESERKRERERERDLIGALPRHGDAGSDLRLIYELIAVGVKPIEIIFEHSKGVLKLDPEDTLLARSPL